MKYYILLISCVLGIAQVNAISRENRNKSSQNEINSIVSLKNRLISSPNTVLEEAHRSHSIRNMLREIVNNEESRKSRRNRRVYLEGLSILSQTASSPRNREMYKNKLHRAEAGGHNARYPEENRETHSRS